MSNVMKPPTLTTSAVSSNEDNNFNNDVTVVGFLAGCLVCTTGGSLSEEQHIRDIVTQHGGKFCRNFDPKLVTHLIVRKVGSKKHETAIRQKIWTVDLAWLLDSDAKGLRLEETAYRVGPFLGLNISVTQLDIEERERVQELVRGGGGVFSSTMRQEACTHLIAEQPSGEKYSAARSWGDIWLVTKEWVYSCSSLNSWCSEKNFPVLSEVQHFTAAGRSRNGTSHRSSSSEIITTRPEDVIASIGGVEVSHEVSGHTIPPATRTHLDGSSAIHVVHKEEVCIIGTEEEVELALLTMSVPHCKSTSTGESPRQFHSFLAAYYAELSLEEYRSASDNSSGGSVFFRRNALEGEVFFVGGFSDESEVLIRQLVVLGGGFLHQMLSGSVSVVLLGSRASDRLKRSTLLHPLRPLPLTVGWLLRSVLRECCTEPSVAEINQQIELNRTKAALSLLQKNNKNTFINSYENYQLYAHRERTDNGDSSAVSRTDASECEDCDLFDFTDVPRPRLASARPVVMTWKQKEKENANITLKLIEKKRFVDRSSNTNINSNVVSVVESGGKLVGSEGKSGDVATSTSTDITSTSSESGDLNSSNRKPKRKGVIFHQSDNNSNDVLPSVQSNAHIMKRTTAFPQRKSARHADKMAEGNKLSSSMPPGESQIAVFDSSIKESDLLEDDW